MPDHSSREHKSTREALFQAKARGYANIELKSDAQVTTELWTHEILSRDFLECFGTSIT